MSQTNHVSTLNLSLEVRDQNNKSKKILNVEGFNLGHSPAAFEDGETCMSEVGVASGS